MEKKINFSEDMDDKDEMKELRAMLDFDMAMADELEEQSSPNREMVE